MSTVKITFALIYGPDAMYVSRCECRGCKELFIQVVHVSTVTRVESDLKDAGVRVTNLSQIGCARRLRKIERS